MTNGIFMLYLPSQRTARTISLAIFYKTSEKENVKMKAGILKLLRFFGVDVLILGLLDKLLRRLVKKISSWHERIQALLAERNA